MPNPKQIPRNNDAHEPQVEGYSIIDSSGGVDQSGQIPGNNDVHEPQVEGYSIINSSGNRKLVDSPSTTSSSRSLRKKMLQRSNRNIKQREGRAIEKSSISHALGLEEAISILYRKRDQEHETEVLGTYMESDDSRFIDYRRIYSPGTVYIVDRDSLEVRLVARITTFDSMSIHDREELQKVFSHLGEDSKFKSNITRNGAMMGGNMYALGWRAGYDPGVSMGTYAPKASVIKQGDSMREKWEILKTQERKVHDIYGKRFCSLAPSLFNNTREFLEKNSLPYLGYKYDESIPNDAQSYVFASNLTYTIKNFFNKAHHDHDASDVTYGIWAPCDSDGNMAEKEKTNFVKKDGFFYVAPYKLIVDFAAVDGVVELIWRGSSDAHATVPGEVSEGYETWGSSCQTSRHLLNRIEKALKDVTDRKDIHVKYN